VLLTVRSAPERYHGGDDEASWGRVSEGEVAGRL